MDKITMLSIMSSSMTLVDAILNKIFSTAGNKPCNEPGSYTIYLGYNRSTGQFTNTKLRNTSIMLNSKEVMKTKLNTCTSKCTNCDHSQYMVYYLILYDEVSRDSHACALLFSYQQAKFYIYFFDPNGHYNTSEQEDKFIDSDLIKTFFTTNYSDFIFEHIFQYNGESLDGPHTRLRTEQVKSHTTRLWNDGICGLHTLLFIISKIRHKQKLNNIVEEYKLIEINNIGYEQKIFDTFKKCVELIKLKPDDNLYNWMINYVVRYKMLIEIIQAYKTYTDSNQFLHDIYRFITIHKNFNNFDEQLISVLSDIINDQDNIISQRDANINKIRQSISTAIVKIIDKIIIP